MYGVEGDRVGRMEGDGDQIVAGSTTFILKVKLILDSKGPQ